MATYKFISLGGGDWTIQKDSGKVYTGSSSSQAAATVVSGKVSVVTYYPYFEDEINLSTNIIQIDNVDVTANGAAAIVEQLNEEVFVGASGGGGGTSTLQQVLDAGTTLDKNNTIQGGEYLLTIVNGDADEVAEFSSFKQDPKNVRLDYQTADGQGGGIAHVDGNNLRVRLAFFDETDITDLRISSTEATLTKNSAAFEATADSHIATKKYVDDKVRVADDYANDAAAAAGGIGVGELYHTSGTVKIRLV